MAEGTCPIPDCGRRVHRSGLCASHARRLEEFGDPLAGPPIRSYSAAPPQARDVEGRFWAKVEIPTDNPLGCWEWQAAVNPHSNPESRYGIFQISSGKRVYAHRLAYEITLGKIDPGMTIDHLCRNTLCVNPLHLHVVTQGENNRRRPDRMVTHCPQGHPYSGDNLYEHGGRRYCLTCRRERRLAS